MKKIEFLLQTKERIYLLANLIMLFSIIPILFLTFIWGNEIEYWDAMKIQTVQPNIILFIIAIICIIVYCFASRIINRFRIDNVKKNLLINIFLLISFTGIYFLNVSIAKEIAFRLPWDVMVVRGGAFDVAAEKAFGYNVYYSMYKNNISITYILGKLLKRISECKEYAYPLEFFWIQINCVLVSVAGFFSCLIVKKLTKKIIPIFLTFFSYFILAAMSAWKIAPYTDTYGMIFPIISIYFYVIYRQNDTKWKKIIFLFTSLIFGMIGGFVKPSIYIIVLAILIIEFIELVANFKKNIGYFIIDICLVLVLFMGISQYTQYIIDQIGLEFNQEIEESWHHYFLMGLNDNTTGGYNMEDVALIGQYQESKTERNIAEMELAFERIKERGFWGSICFWSKKMVMTFNDGTFGWNTEVWIDSYYDGLASNNNWTETLRYIYWDGPFVGAYNTICQMIWIFILLCIPGICFGKGEKLNQNIILTVSFLGIFFYQLLFEARARYLFTFLPLLISVSVIGLNNYCALLTKYLHSLRALRKSENSLGQDDA